MFIKVTCPISFKNMIIRVDDIWKVENHTVQSNGRTIDCRKIYFRNGESDYVTESIDDLIKLLPS